MCEPGKVDSLMNCMKRAVEMEDAQYERMSRLTKEGLGDYVRPLDEYASEYLTLLGRK